MTEAMEGAETRLSFYVNGREVHVDRPDPEMTLLYFLRNNLCLTGSKLGCGEGGCGACTVTVSRFHGRSETVRHTAVNACLAPLCSMHGAAVTTVEGIGSTRTRLHPCQERIARAHGSQCGFCTPGFVMSMYSLLRSCPAPTDEQVEAAFEGNLCRCTGYRPILDGYKTLAQKGTCGGGGGGGGGGGEGDRQGDEDTIEGPHALFDASKFLPLDPTQELIFPPALRLEGAPPPLAFSGPRVQWFRPASLRQLLSLRHRFPQHSEPDQPQHRIVVGNTEIGVDMRIRGVQYSVLIDASCVGKLEEVEVREEEVVVGAGLSINQLADTLGKLHTSLPEHKARVCAALLEMTRWFAGQQIRNVACLGGNIINASPISDLIPILMAARARLNFASIDSQRTIPLDAGFFTGYKRTAMKPNEVLLSVTIPYTREDEFIFSYKQARRREDDIAIVNAGFRVLLQPSPPPTGSSPPNAGTVVECTIAYGGMSYVPVMATKTAQALVGRPWDEAMLEAACELLQSEVVLAANAPGGMPEYRRSLVSSFFFKFFCSVLQGAGQGAGLLAPEWCSVTRPFQRPLVRGVQGFQRVPTGQTAEDMVGRPVMHVSALLQATGEARYLDDIPHQVGELSAALVLSTHPHARISVDASAAVSCEGVMAYVSVDDVPGSNVTGPSMDECVFADGEVTSAGQIIGIVVATTQPLAQRAAKAVRVTYQDLPSIITIKEAISAESFFPLVRRVCQGDVESGLEGAEHVLEGEAAIGGQDHFYLETQACLAAPQGEAGEMVIVASTQGAEITQRLAARALDVPENRIVARTKRIGGGFGGKETRSCYLSTAVAVAAHKVQAPVRIQLDRNEDMISSGSRHPFLGRFKVGFTGAGRVTALRLLLYSNGGYSYDLSVGVLDRAITHADNVYSIANVLIEGRICRTNLPSNTAFRGFGGPQGMFITEHIMSSIIAYLQLPPEQVRAINFYRDGDETPFGMAMPVCHIRRCWASLKEKSSYEARKAAVDSFNRSNHWTKRGLALVPTKYGVSFGLELLNQAGALVHVYRDGSVLLTHGGIEMGQGLHTKVIQVCARCLGIPVERVFISETSTATVANSSPTAASFSTDLYGMATKDACEQLMARLAPVMSAHAGAGWERWVEEAYSCRIDLTAHGFHATPDLHFDWEKGRGNLFSYFAYGVSCSEVEVDTLTGDFHVLRSDLLMDVGDSINPAIDIGQVEGAFTQGLGLFTLEQCVFLEGTQRTQRGQLFTTGPGTYKIPSATDVPVELNVLLMDHTPNPSAIFSSKAVGEPPLFLAASVFFAVKDAIAAARAERGLPTMFTLDSPATCERIRLACSDQFTKQACGAVDSAAKRWTIDDV